MGWIIVIAYLATASLCFLARARTQLDQPSRSVWTALAAILCALGVNKQLDLQSLGTAVARHLAQNEGWYDAWREAQALFILGICAMMLLAMVALTIIARRVGRWPRLSIVGLILLLGFVTVRAVSFHHIDALIGFKFAGVRLNHVLELGGITVIGSAALGSCLTGAGIGRVVHTAS